MARSTVDGVLRRQHMSRLAQTDQTSGVVVRYQREHPRSWAASPTVAATASTAELLANRGRGIGYDDLHSAVDDRSRVAFSQLLPDEQATTAVRFLVEAAGFFADHGVRIQRILTDNAKASTESVTFAETAAGLGIRLKRTRRYRPQTNGKVERFHRTLLEEWPMGGWTAPTPSAAAPSPGGCGSTITGDHTPRSTA
jgi:transposase InsO family protein